MKSTIAIIAAAFAMLAAVAPAASAAGGFPENLTGYWDGRYCNGKSSTAWVIVMNSARAYARERWCNAITCGDIDYRVTQISGSSNRFEVVPYYATGFSVKYFSIVFSASSDGKSLVGTFHGHPRCRDIYLRWTSTKVVSPISARTPAPLPRSVQYVVARPPQPPALPKNNTPYSTAPRCRTVMKPGPLPGGGCCRDFPVTVCD